MWSVSCATPEPAGRAGDPLPETGLATRAARVAGLLVHLGRIRAAASLVAGRLDREASFALRRRYAGRVLAALGLEIDVAGDPPPYDEPVLVVANHVSWLDPYALNCLTGARFVAKSEVAGWPVVGHSARRFGSFFIERGSCRSAARVKDQMARALRSRDPVAAFPESTTTDGRRLLPFYPAMFQAAIDARAMVQPVALRYLASDGRPTDAAAFVDDMTIADSLRRLLPQRKLVVELTFCPPLYSRGRSRRELATRARRAIADALGLAHDEEPPRPAHLYPQTRRAA